MEAWTQLLAAYPWLRPIQDAFCIIVPLGFLLAYAGIFFISATARILSVTRKRASFAKCARQIAFIGLIVGWTLLIAGRVWLYYTQPAHAAGTLENFMREMSWMFLSLGVLLSSIYYTLWRILKNMPVLHVTLGMISGCQNCIALLAALFTIRLANASAVMDNTALPDLLPEAWNAPLWSAAAWTTPLIFALGAALGGFWLICRRRHEDFGRDYYNAMLAWLSAWTRNCWSILWLLFLLASALQVYFLWQNRSFSEEDAIWESARVLLWFIPTLLWAFVYKSQYPLRQRWLFIVAFMIGLAFTLPYYVELTQI